MGRKRGFDYDEVIERATRLFWAKGYATTSLRDLLEAMGIGESSFYNLVKSKQDLYLECLRHYNNTVTRRRWEALAAEPSIRDGVRAYFRVVLDDLDDPAVPNVCLMAGSMSADVLGADELRDYVVTEMRQLQLMLTELLATEMPEPFDADTAAATIVTYLQGLFRVARILTDRTHLERQVEALLSGLGLLSVHRYRCGAARRLVALGCPVSLLTCLLAARVMSTYRGCRPARTVRAGSCGCPASWLI